MRKTNKVECSRPIAVDISTLAAMLGCGEGSARKIAESAQARFNIGKRVLYSVRKIEEYVHNVAS